MMSRRAFREALVGAVGLVAFPTSAAPIDRRAAQVDRLFADYLGDVVLVSRHGKRLLQRAYGMADTHTQGKCDINTAFRMASISKIFTSTINLMLVKNGALQLDSRLTTHLPGLPKFYNTITIEHLLTHTSGLPDDEGDIPETLGFFITAQNVQEIVGGKPALSFTPGSKFAYSNSGYCLLSLVAESILKKSFSVILREMIFAPLGMMQTMLFQPGRSVINNRACGTLRKGVW